MSNDYRKFLIPFLVSMSLILFMNWGYAQEQMPFSIGQDKPLTIEWLQFEQGYPIRIQNTSNRLIKYLVARIKPADGFSKINLDIIESKVEYEVAEESKICVATIPITENQTTCGYRVGEFYNLKPRNSNNFLISLNKNFVKKNKIPNYPINFEITVNDSSFKSIKRQITINPPFFQVNIRSKTLDIETFDFLDLNFFEIFNNLSDKLLFSRDSLKVFCGKKVFLTPNCISNTKLFENKKITEDIYNFPEIVFEKNNGIGQNIYAKIKFSENQVYLDFSDKNTNYEIGDYTAKPERFFGSDRNPLNLNLRVRSNWGIVIFFLVLGIFLALFLRVLQGSPLQRLLHRVDSAKLNFLETAGIALQDHGFQIRKAMFVKAWDLTKRIQDFRALNSSSFDPNSTEYQSLADSITEYENFSEKWNEFMLCLDLFEIKNFLGNINFNPKASTVDGNNQDITQKSLTEFFRGVEKNFYFAEKIKNNYFLGDFKDLREKNRNFKIVISKILMSFFGIILLNISVYFINRGFNNMINTFLIIISAIFTFSGWFFHRPRILIKNTWVTLIGIVIFFPSLVLSSTSNFQNGFYIYLLSFGFLLSLISWLWSRVWWILGWYKILFLNFLSPVKVSGQPTLKIYWWNTLPIIISFGVALINGMNEFYFKDSSTSIILQQLSWIAWGFGSTTAVQALFAVLEKSPLGRYF